MAWLSVGTSNEDLCDKMMDYGILEEGIILNAFRSTDKGDFVLEKDRLEAYQDRPFKKGNVHISAPHMYVTVLGGLELEPGISFLNVGSGSGYLSCLVSHIIGPSGLCHGIEINEEAVNHSRACTSKWMDKYIEALVAKENLESEIDSFPGKGDFTSNNCMVNKTNIQMVRDSITFTHGNCFHLNTSNIISHGKYDRIYVGAGCPVSHKDFFCHLLELNGILILPIHETSKMMKYKCIADGVYTSEVICTVTFAPLVSTTNCSEYLTACDANYEVPFKSAEMDILSAVYSNVGSTSSVNNVANIEVNAVSKVMVHKNIGDILTTALVTAESSDAKKNTKKKSDGSMHISATSTMPTAPLPNSVTLPPVLWSPNKYRHRQYPATFRDAVFAILMCSRYVSSVDHCPVDYNGSGSSSIGAGSNSSGITSRTASSTGSESNSSSGKSSDVTDSSFSSVTVSFVGVGESNRVLKKRSAYGLLPSQIWIYIITFCNRDWFNPPVSAIQLLTQSLLLERKLRSLSEEKLETAIAARRAAERERDLYRNVMARMSRASRQAYLAEGEEDSEEEKEEIEEEKEEEEDNVTVEDMDEEEEQEEDDEQEEEEMEDVSEEDSDPEPDSDDDSVEEAVLDPDSDDDTVETAQQLPPALSLTQEPSTMPIVAWSCSDTDDNTAIDNATNTASALFSAVVTSTPSAAVSGAAASSVGDTSHSRLQAYGNSSNGYFTQYRNIDNSCDTTVLSSHFTINDTDYDEQVSEYNTTEYSSDQHTEVNNISGNNNIGNASNNSNISNSMYSGNNDHMLCTSFDSHTTHDYSLSYLISTDMHEYSSSTIGRALNSSNNNNNCSNNGNIENNMFISPIKPTRSNNNINHNHSSSKESRHRKYSNISELSFDESIADEAESAVDNDYHPFTGAYNTMTHTSNSSGNSTGANNTFVSYSSYNSYLHSIGDHTSASPAHKISKTCSGDRSNSDICVEF